ncbi:hypothetical protein FA95DRAFT_1578466, partial [Auriscalpium vulgare]
TPPGPFNSAHTWISTILDAKLRTTHDPFFGALHVFLNSLLERQYDGAPFILGHPDPDSQNVLVDETGEVSGLIDWDNVEICPRQLGALAFPLWITVDWDPIMYCLYADKPHCDTREDLHMYRNIIMMAIHSEHTRRQVVYHLGAYMFGPTWLTIKLVDGIKGSAWFNRDPNAVAEVKESSPPPESDKNRLEEYVTPEEEDVQTSDGSNESDGEDDDAGSSNGLNDSDDAVVP